MGHGPLAVNGPQLTLLNHKPFLLWLVVKKRIIRKEILKILLNKLELKLQLAEVKKAARCRQPFLYLMNNP
jgi:hypothetical protein